ncbi:heme peroxidase family protein [Isoptericola sp. S6320L]|uniref:peroxidase family protein n=1 Tax=Isoptericola sp. S6320L TaxID=2926411 RepID=UPI001FF64633|nr:heme peroxidase family protein [Isoptericola sp. S6320L]MCK0116678.1 heme peroxidase family protein [Isoptericola sp. S6320L]
MEAPQAGATADQKITAPQTEPSSPDPRVDLNQTPHGRTVRNVGHGGRVVPDTPGTSEAADPRTSDSPFLPRTAAAVLLDYRHGRFDATTSFDYLFARLRTGFPAAHLPSQDAATVAATVTALKSLGEHMIESDARDPAQDSTVPAVYTYWGQFIDHDITLNTNGPDTTAGADGDLALGDIVNDPFTVVRPDDVVASLHNGRHPGLDLDSMYGSGPRLPGEAEGPTRSEVAYSAADPVKLALGRVSTTAVPGFELVEPGDDPQRDLPRFSEQEAQDAGNPGLRRSTKIPDGRNDENLVVAQLHVAFIRFHNAVVDWVRLTQPWLAPDDRATFEQARALVRHHYQWLVLHDYLRTLTRPGVLDQVLHEHTLLFRPLRTIAMPLEFAVAAFRFGHSMVRNGYDFNVNFGPGGAVGFASLENLFRFTGGGGLSPSAAQQLDALPSNWPIDWTRFVDKGEPDPARRARKIDPFLADGLRTMLKEGFGEVDDDGAPLDPAKVPVGADGSPMTQAVSAMLKQLAQRNLLRGYMLALPTGEEVAAELGVAPLTRDQLTAGTAPEVGAALDAIGRGRTPLWYYVLQEAAVEGNGNFLGEVGSRILAETFVYLLRQDDDSFLRTPDPWTPADGVRLEDGRMITTLTDLLRFAGVHPLPDGTFRRVDGRPAGHDGGA